MMRQLIDCWPESHSAWVSKTGPSARHAPAAVESALDLLVRKGRLIKGGPRSGACEGCAAVTLCKPWGCNDALLHRPAAWVDLAHEE